ncbi:helicase sen1-like [Salvia hispanica]|uniref:helicase sen1-like n=1 Tax=Salvia hispanica TaxID=49212 RepID=UPI0020094F38|nr:helicase sen1-like [Salvia hispanica]
MNALFFSLCIARRISLNGETQEAVPASSIGRKDLFVAPAGPQGVSNYHASSRASTVSGLQPLVRTKSAQTCDASAQNRGSININGQGVKAALSDVQEGPIGDRDSEKEEGEWSDAEGSANASTGLHAQERGQVALMQNIACPKGVVRIVLDTETTDKKINRAKDGDEYSASEPKPRISRGNEATHSLRPVNNPGKRPKPDQQKEVMLGKKRGRQTMYLELEDVKQVGASKASTPKQIPAPRALLRTVRETHSALPSTDSGEEQTQSVIGDAEKGDLLTYEGNEVAESNDCKIVSDENSNSATPGPPRTLNGSIDLPLQVQTPLVSSQSSLKHQPNIKQLSQCSGRKPAVSGYTHPKLAVKRHLPQKQSFVNVQDSSVERLLREVTSEKFWNHPDEQKLERVPGRFDSVEEYIRVFEPLLFEECRAQLYNNWEESSEMASSHVRVVIKSIERRERGWFDVVLMPPYEYKWTFKEGDVAVLSICMPGAANARRNGPSPPEDKEKPEVNGRVAGTMRRYMPIGNQGHTGVTLHFFVGDNYNSSSKNDDDHLLRKLRPGDHWYLTPLCSLATTQREYIALHAFRHLHVQMQNAIIQPSPDQFPKYEEQPPAMPDCFTPSFVEHLRRTFNGPQLAAIQWAAMHTAAGTSSGVAKKQEPWPFTLVQGPPGTGKTHTVWGMLNVIHLVQYQRYYAALLKKLAPESYKQADESNSNSTVAVASGSIDEVLQSMNQNLFRTLPKLCPKPRMLVCAPSNAATDELLARVLDRGFIDGEMKIYRADVARVGVDSQNRAAQAVSVEGRTEQLLKKSREEVYGWMHSLRLRETQLSQQIAYLQKELNVVAAAGHAQGSVGVDPDVLMARDQNRDRLLQNLAAIVENRDKLLVEMSRLHILEGRFRAGGNFNFEEARADLEASFANEAEIVFTTVSSSGRKLFSHLTHGFDMVVIDEAAQASEVGILPPLSLGAARCVLVGDPQQLPATVISKAAGTLLYSRSLFERFQQAGCPTMLLSVQYRMHPYIRDFPSKHFYQGRLTDSESVASLPDEVYYKDPLLRPYIFFDIAVGRESHRGGSVSYQNTIEAQFCVRLYQHIQKTIRSLGARRVSVGIITPYKLQLKCLQREFKDVLNSSEGRDVYINTVDAFQGQERDVIIMSCVRASSHGVGFVADIRRMNVALTRARRALWVMGNAKALEQSDDWAALINDAKARKCYLDMNSLPKEFFSEPSTYGAFSSTISNARGLGSGPSYRPQESYSNFGPSEVEAKSTYPYIARLGSNQFMRPPGT